uniref:Secreted protein n=1 Tax=Romanomermis culicivorax TaxID=13658 RepID=A0A915JNI5_ROMCU
MTCREVVLLNLLFPLTFCNELGFNCVLSIILIATSLPVGKCLANLTLAKFPLPIVFNSLYLPMCGSSEARLRDDTRPELLIAER